MVDNLRVVIAAAGAGKRMGAGINKQYLLLGSRPLLCYCLDVFQLSPLVDSIVVVTGSQEVEYCREKVIRPYNYTKVCEVVAGGPERQDSVKTGLAILGNDTDLVAIHDGARPFITTSLLESLYLAASCYGAAIPGVPVKDTIKRFDQDGFVDHTINRAEVYAVQTPQIFKYQILRQAYEKAEKEGLYGTDDASLVERLGGRIKTIPGDYRNIKITTPDDLDYACYLLSCRQGGKGEKNCV